MGYSLACCIVSGSDIGLLQIEWYGHLCHKQTSFISKVLCDPCIPLIDLGIEGRNILTLNGLFVCLTELEGQAHAVHCGLLFWGISSSQRNGCQEAYKNYNCLHDSYSLRLLIPLVC